MKLGWFSELDARERRTFFAAFGGLGLDLMDTTIFALVMPVLISLAILTKAEAGALASLSLIGCGIGGWFAGSLAGRFGRVRMLQMTVVWVAVFTALAAFMHGFWVSPSVVAAHLRFASHWRCKVAMRSATRSQSRRCR